MYDVVRVDLRNRFFPPTATLANTEMIIFSFNIYLKTLFAGKNVGSVISRDKMLCNHAFFTINIQTSCLQSTRGSD